MDNPDLVYWKPLLSWYMYRMYIGLTLVTSHVHSLPTMLCVEDEGQMRHFNYTVVAHINHVSMGPCKPQKGRRDENPFDLSGTKLIIQLLLSDWLCCPDNFRAIYNRLPHQDNTRASCCIIISHGKRSAQNSCDNQKLPRYLRNLQHIPQHTVLFLFFSDYDVMSKNTMRPEVI